MISSAYVFSSHSITESGSRWYQYQRRAHSEEEQPSAAAPATARRAVKQQRPEECKTCATGNAWVPTRGSDTCNPTSGDAKDGSSKNRKGLAVARRGAALRTEAAPSPALPRGGPDTGQLPPPGAQPALAQPTPPLTTLPAPSSCLLLLLIYRVIFTE